MKLLKSNLILALIILISLNISCRKDDNGAETNSSATTIVVPEFEKSIYSVMLLNKSDHGSSDDYVWDATTAVNIQLNGTSIDVNGSGATATGSNLLISNSGTYLISGTLDDGQIVINVSDENTVKLILDGIDIKSSSSSPFHIKAADKTVIILAANSQNYIEDAATYPTDEDANAALYSKDDLTITGTGTLTVKANFNDGITSKDGLIIKDGNIIVTADDDGIRGKDYLVIKGGTLDITASGDGLKADNEDDYDRGYIYIQGGSFDIAAVNDGIQAQTDLLIEDGIINIITDGGSNTVSTASAKGLKGNVCVYVEGGTETLNTADDAIHSDNLIVINLGTINIESADDGIHSDTLLAIYDGDINITKSYEGIESADIVINDGNIHIVASDDGINAAGGNDGSGGGPGGGGPSVGDNYIAINGGYIVVNSVGDGIDANGRIEMNDGVVIVNGPTANNNGALDFDDTFTINGGFLIAVGSKNMASAPGNTSNQYSVLVKSQSTQQAVNLVHIQDSEGNEIVTFSPTKSYSSVVFSSSYLENGSNYDIYFGGSHDGFEDDGLYTDGTYSGGTKYSNFTISSLTTTVN